MDVVVGNGQPQLLVAQHHVVTGQFGQHHHHYGAAVLDRFLYRAVLGFHAAADAAEHVNLPARAESVAKIGCFGMIDRIAGAQRPVVDIDRISHVTGGSLCIHLRIPLRCLHITNGAFRHDPLARHLQVVVARNRLVDQLVKLGVPEQVPPLFQFLVGFLDFLGGGGVVILGKLGWWLHPVGLVTRPHRATGQEDGRCQQQAGPAGN